MLTQVLNKFTQVDFEVLYRKLKLLAGLCDDESRAIYCELITERYARKLRFRKQTEHAFEACIKIYGKNKAPNFSLSVLFIESLRYL